LLLQEIIPVTKLYNTLTRKIEEFKPIEEGKVSLYSCGPTVYDHPHIGNMRTYTSVDLLRSALEYNGFQVKHVMNITDVGHLFGDQDMGRDKIEEAARERKKTAFEIAREYEEEFFEVLKLLNIQRPHVIARATEHILEMIEFIKKIEERGFTYQTSDGIYFDTSKLTDYGILSGIPLSKLKEGARVEKNPEKKNPTDFALWKFSPKDKKRQMEWDSPWGVGFPGWHIECSAMSTKYLGEVFDIHAGGEDHINIHHTNEIAQSQGAYGKIPARFWFHGIFLMVDGKKMSKSLGNFYTMADIQKKGFKMMSLRYLFLTSHYRSRLNFTWDALAAAEQALVRLQNLVSGWQKGEGRNTINEENLEKIKKFQQDLTIAINSDLDTPGAIAILWQVAKSNLPDPDKKDLVFEFDQVLRLNLAAPSPEEVIPDMIKAKAFQREEKRKEGKWEEADSIRKELEKEGFMIEDTPEGTKISIKRFK